MSERRTQQPLVKQIFRDDYHRKLTGVFNESDPIRENRHMGCDYGADTGEKVYPLEKGLVKFTTKKNTQLERDFGIHVGYYIPSWDVTMTYGHGSSELVATGNKVDVTSELMETGSSGKASGPHLDVMIAKGEHPSLQSVYNNAFDFETFVPKKVSQSSEFEKGDTVYVATGAKSYDGVSVSNIWYSGKHTIDELKGDRAVLDIGKGTTAFNIRDLIHYDETPNTSTPSPKPVEDKTGQTLVIYPQWLEGSKDVDLLRRDGTKYPNGINSSNGRERRYKIVEQVSDGFYKVKVPNADTSETYIKWRVGIGFEKA